MADPKQVSADRRQATAERLAVDMVSTDARARNDAFTLVWAGEWVVDRAGMTADLDRPVEQLTGRPATPGQPG